MQAKRENCSFGPQYPWKPTGSPVKPKHFGPVASAKWDDLIALFEAMGTLNQADGDLIALYCDTYAAYRVALDNVNKLGQVLVTKREDGTPEAEKSPFSAELHRYADRCHRLLSEMKLTQSSTPPRGEAVPEPPKPAPKKLIYRFPKKTVTRV